MDNNVKMKAEMRLVLDNPILENYNFQAYIDVFITEDDTELYQVELHDTKNEWSHFREQCGSMKEAHTILLNQVKIEFGERLRQIIHKGKWAQEHLDTLNEFKL